MGEEDVNDQLDVYLRKKWDDQNIFWLFSSAILEESRTRLRAEMTVYNGRRQNGRTGRARARSAEIRSADARKQDDLTSCVASQLTASV